MSHAGRIAKAARSQAIFLAWFAVTSRDVASSWPNAGPIHRGSLLLRGLFLRLWPDGGSSRIAPIRRSCGRTPCNSPRGFAQNPFVAPDDGPDGRRFIARASTLASDSSLRMPAFPDSTRSPSKQDDRLSRRTGQRRPAEYSPDGRLHLRTDNRAAIERQAVVDDYPRWQFIRTCTPAIPSLDDDL